MRKSATGSKNAQQFHDQLERYVTSLLVELDERLDKRLVRTFLLTIRRCLPSAIVATACC